MRCLFRVIVSDKLGVKKLSDGELVEAFAGLNPQIIVWASDEVLKIFKSYFAKQIRQADIQWSGGVCDECSR